MNFLRTLFWVVVAVAAAIFSFRNWTTVPVNLWGGLVADTKLPVLLGAAFLLGLAPPFVAWRATRWRLRRRLAQTERSLSEARIAEGPAPPPAAPHPEPLPAEPLPEPAAAVILAKPPVL